MPPKGFRKGYVKHPETGEYVDPRVLEQEREEKKKEAVLPGKVHTKPVPAVKKKKVKDDLGATTKNVDDTRKHATVIVTWRDDRGRERSTQYVMADLNLSENVNETFENAKKKTRIHLNLDGNVLEKV